MIDIRALEESIKVGEDKALNLRPDIEKKIIWDNEPSIKTKISLVFIHGFSATRAELSPVIENIAKELKANVFFTRLTGHGQDGESLGKARYEDWLNDTKEAIKIGEIIGEQIILIGSSTGCSLIHPLLIDQMPIKAAIYVSPNFGPISYLGKLLRVPGARWFMPLFFGKTHSFKPKNLEHKRCWTTSYPTSALFAVKDSVVAASNVEHNIINLPVLFWFSDGDRVVSAKATRKIISRMGESAHIFNPTLTIEDDPSMHGVLGDILSPSQTKNGVSKILEWIKDNN